MINSGSFFKYLLTLFILATVASCVISSNPVYYTPSKDYHYVQPDETLSSIGQKYQISVEKLKLFNNLTSDRIFAGQKLYLKPKLSLKREYVTVRPIPASGFHIVRSRERITTIAKMYDVSLIDLLNYNHLSSFELTTGQKLYLKGNQYKQADISKPVKEPKELPREEEKVTEKEAVDKLPKIEKEIRFDKSFGSKPVLPVNGNVSSEFGRRNGKPHKGIDVVAEMGTPILAVLSGEVAYVGNQRGYGNVVILEHDNFIMTVYAHNEANLVREGDRVKSGQPIATVGNSGSTTGPHLHFEYRLKGVARNPRELIPGF